MVKLLSVFGLRELQHLCEIYQMLQTLPAAISEELKAQIIECSLEILKAIKTQSASLFYEPKEKEKAE